MKNQEFINWLEGFTQAMGNNIPTERQWELIKQKLSEVGEPTNRRSWDYLLKPSGTTLSDSAYQAQMLKD
jgi:hypothetical protein